MIKTLNHDISQSFTIIHFGYKYFMCSSKAIDLRAASVLSMNIEHLFRKIFELQSYFKKNEGRTALKLRINGNRKIEH
jgi:hypothetical protein